MQKHMKYSSIFLTLIFCLGLLPTTVMAAVESTNIRCQDYSIKSRPVRSYLYDNGSGLTRVECISDDVEVEDYSYDFELLFSRCIDMELPIFGGFFAGEEYNFLIFGQNNEEEDDDKEVIRIVKYDKDWNRIGDAGLFGANTIHPFHAGSLRCDEYGGYLYVRTCHEMYTTEDGHNHQANLTFSVREKDMEVTDFFYGILNESIGYVSHSFNQFILVDEEGNIISADHGDAYPRSHVLMRYSIKAGEDKFIGRSTSIVDLVVFPGSIGQNSTGSSLGGLVETSQGYVSAYNLCSDSSLSGERDVYLSFVPKKSFSEEKITTAKLTAQPGSSTPVLAPTGLSGGYVLWDEKDGYSNTGNMCYAKYNADGTVGRVTNAPGALSDCQPIPYGSGVVWYVTGESYNDSAPVFYTLDDGGLTAHPSISPAGPEKNGIAYAATQSVNVDGKTVEFQCYALKDGDGNLTNYVKLRDLAAILNGTEAQFSVGWGGSVLINTKRTYTLDGSELNTPYTGDRAYSESTAFTGIDGQNIRLAAFVINDDNGGGYTYYRLRDLAKALGFNVGWSRDKGMFVETDEPYDPNN